MPFAKLKSNNHHRLGLSATPVDEPGAPSLRSLLKSIGLVAGGTITLSASAAVEIIKSPNDSRDYLSFAMANQMQVVVVSDPAAEKAAASLVVEVGSDADPQDRQGLAHFLEHMLFLGTEKYPESGEYKAFIASNSGTDNAYTALDHTNYFFDVEQSALEPALDRFAQFFVAPLFTAKYVNRERQVVHSEYRAKLRNDGWRSRTALQQIYNPNHPLARFNVGNADTLADRAEQPIRDQLIAFYERHYSANLMNLVVYGREPVKQLRRWVEEKFAAVPNRNAQPIDTDQRLFAEQTLPRRLGTVPVRSFRRLSVQFPVPSPKPHYQKKPLSYLSNLLGHEGEGSLLSLLRSRGLADSLWAGTSTDYQDEALFGVSLELTEAGVTHVDTIVDLIFQTLRLIERDGIAEWHFKEQQRMAGIGFQFQEASEPLSTARRLASSMIDLPLVDLLRGPYALDHFDAELINAYLQQMRPDRVLVTLTASEVAEHADQQAPWFQTPYRTEAVDQASQQRWATGRIDTALQLPGPNEFIPEELAIKIAPDGSARPELLREASGFEFWYQQDQQFQVPKAELYFALRSPAANESPRATVLTELFVRMCNDLLVEYTYPATLAGLNYRLYRHLRGFSVRISGYDDRQDRLLARILDTLDDPKFVAERFAIKKAELSRDLRDRAQEAPYRQAYKEVVHLLMVPSWSDQQQIDALAGLSVEHLIAFAPLLRERAEVAALSFGNVDRTTALALAEMLEHRLLGGTERVKVPRGASIKLQSGEDLERELAIDHQDSALLIYFQGDDKSLQQRAGFALLGQLIESPFFEDLRTENKLGYIVTSSPLPILEVPGLVFVVQSPSASPAQIEAHVERFLDEFEQRLAMLSAEEFKRYRESLAKLVLRQDKTLQDRAERYWTEIDREEFHFESRSLMANAVREQTLADVLGYYRRFLNSQDRRRLVVRSAEQGNQAVDTTEPAVSQSTERSALIRDAASFKAGREVFPG